MENDHTSLPLLKHMRGLGKTLALDKKRSGLTETDEIKKPKETEKNKKSYGG